MIDVMTRAVSTVGGNDPLAIGGGASLFTYDDNRVDANTNDAAFALAVIATR